jgi:archaellum component FlaC
MAQKTNFTVVRNAAYTAASIEVRERHNERKNESYYNADIVPERASLNVRFRQNFLPDGTSETYQQTFNHLLENGTIVKRGLKADAKVFDELVFDVNTAYFDENGGYDFAKQFYESAYRLAVKEVGGEDYILSAVMHADEKNVALSEQLERDVYHYHLHVVYVPVVQKEVLWTKRCKDPALVGTVKEVIPQISHSKKWPKYKDETGKWINSYSLLQDRFFEGMRVAGFDGFERGERGSTAEHLEVQEYKFQQNKKRLDDVSAQVEKTETRLEKLDSQLVVKERAKATVAEVEAMGRPALLGGFNVTADEMKKLKTLAKKSVTIDQQITESKRKLDTVKQEMAALESELESVKRDCDIWRSRYNNLMAEVKDFLSAIRNFPQRLREFIDGHWRERRRQKTQNREDVR